MQWHMTVPATTISTIPSKTDIPIVNTEIIADILLKRFS
jgi:hypothetical protein